MFAGEAPSYIADHIRRVLLDGASAPHSEDVQRFFKEEVASRGWYTAELRKVAYRFHRVLLKEHGVEYLVAVADNLFRGRVLEEKTMAVMLLESWERNNSGCSTSGSTASRTGRTMMRSCTT